MSQRAQRPHESSPRQALRGLWVAACVLSFGVAVAFAADKPDKPNKPDKPVDKPGRIDKIERQLERAEAAGLIEPRGSTQVMAQPGPQPERSSRTERSDRPERAGSRGERPSNGASESRSVPATPADPKFEPFRLITERNIFNPNRVGRTRERAEERPPRVDTIALVGTMHSDQGVVAFFDSPDPSYRKALREGQTLGEFRVKKIEPDAVELTRNDQPVALKVAQQLVRPEGGEWAVSGAERVGQVSDLPSGGSETRPTASTPPPVPADASDVVRRMMEQRQKQLKQ